MLPPNKENYINRKGVAVGLPTTPIVADVDFQRNQTEPGQNISAIDMWKNALSAPKELGVADIPLSSFYIGSRYKQTLPGTDYEEMAASGQSAGEKWANGSLKLLGTAGTSFVSGTLGLVHGIGASIAEQRLASLIDNPTTRKMDEVMQGLEDYAPNYYSHEEQDANWYSPKNILTANFWSDKVLKNLGYSVGAIGGGVAWGSLFRSIGLTNRLVQAGRGMEAATAIEGSMSAVPNMQKLNAFESALNSMAQKYIKSPVSAVLKDSDRILTSTMGTFGEASMEGLQGMNEYRRDAIEEYKKMYGVEPTGEALNKINESADQVGMYIWGGNSLLLTGTNYIQLPKILGSSRKADKALINEITKDAETGLYKQVVPKTTFGRIAQKAKGVSQVLFAPSEAFEEGMQFSIQTGVTNYFQRARENKQDTRDFLSTLSGAMGNVFGEGIHETLTTKEGLESILIGGLSGGLQQAGYFGSYKDDKGKTRYGVGKSGVIGEQGLFGFSGQKQTNTVQAIQSLNKKSTEQVLKDQVKFLSIGIGSQQLRQEAIRQDDTLSEKDYEKDFALSYLMPRIKYGKVLSVIEELDGYKNQAMTEEGFNQLKTSGIVSPKEDRNQFVARINSLQEQTNKIDNLYDVLNDKYSNKVNSEGKLLFTEDIIDRLVYATSKISDYDTRIPELNINLTANSIDTLSVLQSIQENNKPSREAVDSALKQINSIDTIQETKDDLKSDLIDVIELSLRRKQFIEEYNVIKRNPLNYQEREIDDAPTTIEIAQKEKVEGKRNRQIKKVELQVGKEYSLKEPLYKNNNELHLSPKITILSSTLGGEYEVRMPNGKVQFLTPTEFKEYNISPSEDNTDEALVKALDNSIDTILKSEKFSTINIPDTVQNKLAYINSLDNKELVDAIQREFNKNTKTLLENREKERIAREKLAMEKEALDKQQTSLELTSADVETIPITSEDFVGSEDKRKDVDILFLSTTSTSEETDDKPHSKRARTFLNNFKFFTNKDKVKTILVTPNNAKELGLEGIVQMSYGKELTDSLSEEETNIDLGFMAQVVILQLPEGDYFSDDKGNKLSKVGEESPTILDNVVFQTMTSASLYTTGGFEKVRKGQEEQAELALEAYKIFRKEVFSQKGYTPYSFSISRGVPKQNKIDGKKEDNPVKWILGTDAENIISTHTGLISVVTTGKVENNGELLSFPVGTTLIQYGDLLDYVNNKRLTSKQSQSIFSVIEALSKDLIEKSNNDQPLKIDFNYSKFLQNVLFWKSKGNTSSPSQIGIDTTKMEFKIGDKAFSLFSISDNKDTIIEALQKAFINVNNITLSEGVSKKFTEYTVDKDGNLSTVIWKNYQTYLLSDKNPDGSKRSTEDIPLITHTAASTDTSPSYKQKYMFITDRDVLPYTKVPAKGVKKQTTTPSSSVGEYTLDGTTQNTFTLNTGPIQFTATINDGVVNVDVQTNDTINKLSTEQALTTAVDNNLASLPEELITIDLSKATNEEKALLFVKLRIESELGKQLETPAPLVKEEKVQPMAPPKVVARHDLEAKKAEIERRKQNEISQLDKSNRTFSESEINKASSNEVSTLKEVQNSDVIKQAKIDQDLHDAVQGTDRFSERDKKFLEEDKKLKQRFIDLIEGKNVSDEEINDVIKGLTKDKAIHGQYLKMPENENTGSYTWHNHWISVYDGWLGKLNDLKQINAKYDAELAKLEEPTEKPNLFNSNFKLGQRNNAPEYRVIGNESGEQMTNADLEIFKQWHQKNVPFIPFEILERIIRTQYNTEAWGVFENGVAKFVKGGLRGTEYHEIFEAIWADFLSEQEKQAILQEFKSKKGEFTDRASGITYQYSDPYLSDNLIKERIADDFSDFRLGKITRKTLGDKIADFFQSILNFFKAFVARPSLKDSLFKAIDSGRFKGTKLSNGSRTSPPQYRAIEGLSEEQTNDFVQDMVSQVKLIIFGEGRKDLLFNPEKMTGEEVFSKVKDIYQSLGALDALGEERYNSLVKKSIEFLRTIGISFNQDEVVSINNEESNNRDYAPEAFSTDWKQHSTGAIKFLLSTLTERKPLNQSNTQPGQQLNISDVKKSNIDGYKLLNFNKVFVTLFDRLHNTTDPKIFAKKLVQLAKEDANYLPVFRALGGNLVTHSFDFDNFGDSDWRLFIQFFNTFTRQKPEALIQYISEEGDVYTSNANVFSIINQTVDSWVANMKVLGKAHGNLISYDKKEKVYKINKEAIKKTPIKKPKEMIDFLSSIGVDFPIGSYDALSDREAIIKGKLTSEMKLFTNAVASIYTQLGNNNDLMTFDTKRLQINGPLRVLSALYTKVNNPNQDSTYFGVEGQRIGSFSENNAPSYFENNFNESETLDELLQKMPQLHDVYSKGSEILKKGGLFFDAQGKRIAEIKVEYIQGTKNEVTGKDKSTSKLTLGERTVQEINQNINGKYYVLIPGDSSTEWMMNLGNVISMDEVQANTHWNKVYKIYNNYLNDEINLALDNRKQNLYTREHSQELRILRDVLPQHIVQEIEGMIKGDYPLEEIQEFVITKNKKEINDSIKEFIENISKETIKNLINSNEISSAGENEYVLNNFDSQFLKDYKLQGKISYDDILNTINFVNINYTINNQEYHKVLFGDPYQFKTSKGKLDETKRIKSFLSPRRRTFDTPEYNNFLNKKFNTINGVQLTEGTPGYNNNKSYTNTVTFNDVDIVGSIATIKEIAQEIKNPFSKTNETDAMSWLMDYTHKEIALKEGQWSEQAEAFHQWNMAYTRRAFDTKNISKYTNEALREHDNNLLSSPMPKHKLAVRKPIISGNKNGKTEIDLLLDKTSQMGLYFHMVEGKALEKMYIQMFKQNIGYGIVVSGRKVGTEELHSLYNEDGTFNTSEYTNIIEVPWKIYGTQVETMSEGEKTQTRGSQPTKIATSDLFENGEPIGATPERKEVIRKAVERHDDALDMLNENGYNELLNKLGITDLGDEYVLEDNQKISETLMYEMMRRQLSENAKDTIQLDEETKEFLIPFEASPSYTQIKNILYSMVNKALISPSMSGAPHVQVPVTMFEKATKGRSLAIKTEEGWVKITKNQYDSLTEEEKKKVLLTDSTLKFYTPDAPYCEIMLPAWFKNKLKKGKFKTDEDLLNYLNSTKEGQKILSGIGFRIPTQALSSMEVFRVKGFLPDYMGYTVVVPSEITTKAGSDFDIDKLNMYLKSIYIDSKGDIKLVSYKGSEQATKDFYSDVYEQTIQKEIDKIQQYDEFREQLFSLFHVLEDVSLPLTKEQQRFYDVHEFMINNIVEQADESDMLPSEYILDQIKLLGNKENKLNSNLLNTVLKDKFVQDNYRKSLENEYYDSIEELLTLPENFSKLITPVSDGGLEAISELLDTTRGYNESDIKARLINRNYMTNLRHAFITGKRWVGIAAVNITNLSLRQKSRVYLDPNKIALLSAQERNFIEDVNIILPHNIINVNGNNYPSLSGTKTADGSQFISERLSGYATAFVDIANKPFITKIIKSDVIVSTFMFLESVGAGNMGIYFLNQPIIERYLEYLDSVNSKSVTNRNHLKYIRSLFPTTEKAIEDTQISTEQLLDNIQEYYTNGKFDTLKNAEQQLILNEFLKYKILADQLFSYTQATNYDTTRFGGSDTLLKKEWATFNVNNFNLISNVTDILTKTFIGKQAELLSKSFASFGVIFKTEIPEIKAYTLSTLKKYATRKYMSTDDYEKIANLIKNSFIDYIIQNNTSIKNMIEPLLLNSETSVVTQLEQAKQKYPSIQLLQDLIPDLGNRENSAKSIQLKANVKDAYSENMYVGMMRELRDTNEELKALYNNIINVAILQGTTQSAISIRNIIPVEDYAKRIAPIIRQLSPNTSLEQFAEGMFERNNFSNKDLFIKFTPHTKELDNAVFDSNTGEETIGYYMPGFKTMKGVTRESRKLIALNGKYNAFELASDYIKVPKVITTKTGAKVNIKTGLQVTSSDYAKMKKQGSFSLYDAYYYKKVYTSNVDQYNNPIPLQIRNSKTGSFEYIYKLINVYGDGNRATEMNTLLTPSQIDNGSIKIQEELTDAEIVSHFSPQIQEESLPLPTIEEPSDMNNTMLRMQPDNIKKIKDGSKTITNRTELFKDGIYSLSDGTKVELKLLGKTKMELADKTDPESQVFEIGTPLEEDWSRDDIAKGEGFKDWDDFVKNNKFSSNFINGSQSRYIYSIKIISEDNSWKEEDNNDSCVPF